MTGNPKVLHDVPADQLLRLKTHKLGRHYHKVPIFIKESSSKHPRIIADYFLRNFRITLELIQVNVHEDCSHEPALRLISPLGRIGFSIERPLLAEVLECYYGGTALAGELPPPNTSEQRLGERLGKEVADLFARMLLGGKSIGPLERYENAYEEVQWEYVAEFRFQAPAACRPPCSCSWTRTWSTSSPARSTAAPHRARTAIRWTRSGNCRCAWTACWPRCR